MINSDLYIAKYKNGVRLTSKPLFQNHSLTQIMAQPLNVYFLDANSRILEFNDETAITLGLYSQRDAQGKSMIELAPFEQGKKFLENDRAVLKNKKLFICEEYASMKCGLDLTAISFKYPWYNENNDLLGIFGFAIAMGRHSISNALNSIREMGLLDGDDTKQLSLQYGDTPITKRQSECLGLLVKGKTYKEIARILNLSPRTVENYIATIKLNFNVNTRSQLIEKVLNKNHSGIE